MKSSLVAGLVALGLVALGGAGGAEAAFPGGNGRIAFTSDRAGNEEIYTMTPNGSDTVRLTRSDALEHYFYPAWSPDGTKIAFTSDRDGDSEIYTIAPNGSNVVRLTTDHTSDFAPAWSPDGTRIAFTSTRDGDFDIYAMAADGSDPVRLTTNAAGDFDPAWSPDGTRIAFRSDRDGNQEVYSMAADGSNPVRLTTNAADDFVDAWSPDGTRIAFTSDRDGDSEIYTIAPNGSNVVRLTSHAASDHGSAWSPDGTRLAFTSTRDGNPEIYTMAADGSNSVRLTNNAAGDFGADWQPIPVTASPPVPVVCANEGAPGYVHPAKMRVLRSRVLRDKRRLDVLAPITSRARGEVRVIYQADGRRDTFNAKVTSGDATLDRIRFQEPITRGQARLGTGIVTLDYQGDADTRAQEVRLRAAARRAKLDVEQISLTDGGLSARGSVTRRARGVVRLRFSYLDATGTPQIYPARAEIEDDGEWELTDDPVPPQLARCGGYLSILFTGYFPQRIRGEMLAYQLNPGQTRRP